MTAARSIDQALIPEVTGTKVWMTRLNPNPPHHCPVVVSRTATDALVNAKPEVDDAVPLIDPVQLAP